MLRTRFLLANRATNQILSSRRFSNGATKTKSVLIFGGGGQLGREVVKKFSLEKWTVISVDFSGQKVPPGCLALDLTTDSKADCVTILDQLKYHKLSLDVVVSVAGGWVGGNIISESIFESTEKMFHMNVMSSVLASNVAANKLNENGLLVLTGAAAGTEPTPEMISYGMSKAATHQLIQSLSRSNSMPKGTVVIGILPVTLDTDSNRKFMGGPKPNWTPLQAVADQIFGWSSLNIPRPSSGALIKITTENFKTTFKE